MTYGSRRARAVALFVALAAGVAAAWLVGDYTAAQRRRGGAPLDVAVASAPIARGTRIDAAALASSVGRRTVPRSFAPVGVVGAGDDLLGAVAEVDIPAGAYLTAADFAGGSSSDSAGYRLRADERAITISGVISPDDAGAAPGGQADLYASGVGGGSSTELVVTGAEILAIGDGADGGDGANSGADPSAGAGVDRSRVGAPPERRVTLRLSQRQTQAVIHADAFAKELRVVMRP